MTYDDSHGAMLAIGDCIEVMKKLEAESIDAVVCDPPYALEFMGKKWDRHETPKGFQNWCEQWAVEAFRVLKPGGHLLAFGGTRTYHRLTCGIEDAGFEIRDCIAWHYGSGFPKSRNLLGEWEGWGTALKPATEPIVVARKPLVGTVIQNVMKHGTGALNIDGTRITVDPDDPLTTATFVGSDPGTGRTMGDGWENQGEDVPMWNGKGRWPANLILSHSEGCVEVGMRKVKTGTAGGNSSHGFRKDHVGGEPTEYRPDAEGFADEDGTETIPAYECVPGCPVADMDQQSGVSKDGTAVKRNDVTSNGVTGWGKAPVGTPDVGYDGEGGASRFFYVAKASTAERNEGLSAFPAQRRVIDGFGSIRTRQCSVCGSRAKAPGADARWPNCEHDDWEWVDQHDDAAKDAVKNTHPTVKPIALMRYLCRLVTPPGGKVLDPFAGSGTCGIAAIREGFDYLGIELMPEYAEIAEARLKYARDFLAEPQAMF